MEYIDCVYAEYNMLRPLSVQAVYIVKKLLLFSFYYQL